MHQAGAVLRGDEVGRKHRVCALAVLGAGDEVKRRLVAQADKRGTGEAL